MLSRISIQNYAIIDRLEVDFSARLNIITGETGAGKSIILGALGLILGERADSNVLLNRERKCIVEGTFTGESGTEAVSEFLRTNELEPSDEIVLRREIAPSGKSRAFINDTPVNLSQLGALSTLLVDLHQQFDTLQLGQAEFQREVLDALGGNRADLLRYRTIFSEMTAIRRRLEDLKERKSQFERELDYHQFQFNELEEAAFSENELEDLDTQLRLLTNAEGIRNALTRAVYELEEGESPLCRQVKSLAGALQPFSELHPGLPALVERLQSAYIELQDIASEADRVNGQVGTDPATLERINERLALGYRLLKKHGVKTTAELLAIRSDLQGRLGAVLQIDEEIAAADRGYAEALKGAQALAQTLSGRRKKAARPLEEKVNTMLARIGMPGARLKVEVKEVPLRSDGADEVDFLFDANKSNQFQPLRKVASGGELSRLMLCIKSLVAASMNLPTLIFDEIDTGISGEAAKQVGHIMKDLATARQVLCITHQPQIAGRADAHYFVYKDLKGEAVTTGVRLLSTDERIAAVARMLGGEKPTAAALENAREMVMS